MTRINLLPWREERKKQRQKHFILMVAAAAAAGLAVWAAGHSYYGDLIEYQELRNRILEREVAELDKKISKIKELEETKAKLKARMDVVQQLQQGRPQVVHMMHQLAVTIPDGVYLTSAKQTGNDILLTGVAESNARISSFMERLDSSEWLTNPRLTVIEVKEAQSRRLSEYKLQVSLEGEQLPEAAQEPEPPAAGKQKTTAKKKKKAGNHGA